ncbi:hypothetical protein F53441_14332 [Fusarium austroafricanum]|uniref:Uncharacterized protein n=1 Tax=Fusarium austroafricanum TaxID=2364996 RepID=A0A8H4JFH4_9HYPO|nr:hypothetical protein F53441_14332 [Fusarium austroafricanum]
MCYSNSSTTVCGHTVEEYVQRKKKVNKVRVHFCSTVSATILHELLAIASNNATPDTKDKPTFHTALKETSSFIRLCKACNVWHSGLGYKTIIIPAMKSHVSWVHGLAAKAGAFVKGNDSVWTCQQEWKTHSVDDALALWKHTLGEGKKESPPTKAPTNRTDKTAIVNALNALRPPIPLTPNRPRRYSTTLPVIEELSCQDRFPRTNKTPELNSDRFADHQVFHRGGSSSVPTWIQDRDRSSRGVKTGLKQRLEELAKQQAEHLETASKLAQEQASLWVQL